MVEPNRVLQSGVQRPGTFYSWCVILAATLFSFYIMIQINLFNAISVDLMRELNLDEKQLGYLVAFYFYGNVLFLFPAGILLDRFSIRNLMLVVFTVSVIATYIFSITSSFWLINTTRFILGLAGAFPMLAAVKLTSQWFESRQMALVIGVIVTVSIFGGVIAQTPLALLTQSLGWRYAVQIVAALGMILIMIQFAVVRDKPKGSEKVDFEKQAQLKRIGFWNSLRMVVTNGQNWLGGIYISFLNLPTFIFGAWGTAYLTQARHFTQLQATVVTTTFFIGLTIGSPLVGLISDKMGLRKLPLIIGAILSLAVLLIIMFSPAMPLWVVSCQFLFLGLVNSSQVIGYPVIAESNPRIFTAIATGIGSTVVMAGGMLIPVFVWLLSWSGSNMIVDKVTTYSLADFTRANYLMLLGLIIAVIASLLLKETYCKQLD
ncbi:MAG: transporter, MFS superfamily [uncultured bacterium]|nr:MAG: transporter, MFS superfamily [uncultured bacterium]